MMTGPSAGTRPTGVTVVRKTVGEERGTVNFIALDQKGKSGMAALWASSDPADRAEFHWRLGVPLTLLVLTVLAVPLARTEPRKGRFAGLGSAVLVYLIYANLLAAGRGWLARDQVPEVLGLWWVHGLFLVAAGLMLFVQQGLWLQWRRRFWPRESVA